MTRELLQRLPILLSLCLAAACSAGGDSSGALAQNGADGGQDAHTTEDGATGLDGATDGSQDTAVPDSYVADAPSDIAPQDAPSDVAPQDAPSDVAPQDAPSDANDTGAPPPDAQACGAVGQPCCQGFQCAVGGACTPGGCVQAVTPTSVCGSSSKDATFVSETPPPATVEPWAEVLATVTFANCSQQTWNATDASAGTGYKLGSSNPQDNDTWGAGRVRLPGDVPPHHQVTIPIVLHAPALTGSYGYGWGIVHEAVAWLNERSPNHSVKVQAASKSATICAGMQADVGGKSSASAVLQACIDKTPAGGTLALPPGIYRITSPISINKPITITTSGNSGSQVSCLAPGSQPCAVFQAGPNLMTQRGMVRIGTTNHVALDHIILDGNRDERIGGQAAQTCQAGNNGPGFNASSASCADCAFTYSGSARAVCGTGFEWNGDRATITHSVFRDNGDHDTTMLWADGLTIHQSNGAVVTDNLFQDNSDVGFIIGGGTGAVIKNNRVVQVSQSAFAGLMLDNFNGGTSGDFTGTNVSYNNVFCPGLRCDFGIELGPHAWYLSANIIGGTVQNNDVKGAKFQIMVEGGGTAAKPMTLTANTFGPSPSSAKFNCGTRPTTAFNVSPDSHVTIGPGGPQPTGHLTHHQCP